jgi:predicted Ser/Thr protein kinase/tetratricopeptide (TPR) repeat protein
VSDGLPPEAVRRLLAAGAEPEEIPLAAGGRYRIRRELGRGGMGVVYAADDAQLGRKVALKMISESAASPAARKRFEREALAVARLDHPNIAAVYDATPDYIAMQLVSGGPLSELPREDARRIVALLRDAALAVHHAHERGIVHRDLKPSNLLVEGDRVFVVDFGLAKDTHPDLTLSAPGSALGTPAFMSPEQVEGRSQDVDARTDVYGLGATLHACLTGRPPFDDSDLGRLLRRVVEDDPPAAGAGRELNTVVAKCLAKDPARRYATARELADDLDRWLRREPVLARPPSTADRIRLFVARRRALLRAAGIAAALAVAATGLVLGPIALRESAARSAASEAVELAAGVTAILSDVEAIRREGQMGEANERLDAGIRECEAFLARHPVARVEHLLGKLLSARGRREAALAAFARALEMDPGLPGARFERGVLLADREPEAALADLRAEAESPRLRRIDQIFARAEIARLEGDRTRARRLLGEVRSLDRSHLPAILSLVKVELAEGNDARAFALALGAVSLQRGAPRRGPASGAAGPAGPPAPAAAGR